MLDQSPVERLGIGGSRGGAKSGFLRRAMLLRRLMYENFPGLILRSTMGELKKSHIAKMREEFPGLMDRYYNSSDHELRLPNGSILYFGSADNEVRISQFFSAEMGDIAPDEAQEFSQSMLEKLSGSCRCTSNRLVTSKMLYAFMPGMSEAGLPPVGLSYLKRVFADGQLKPEEQLKKWAFVPMRGWDNIKWVEKELDALGIGRGRAHVDDSACECQECTFYSWSEDDRMNFFLRSEYGTNLLAMASDAGLREAWVYGKFGTFQGQYFQKWDAARHVISVEEAKKRIKPWHTKWPSLDWGYYHPTVVHWHAQDEFGRVITYREHWTKQTDEEDLGKEIGRLSTGERYKGFPCSWDAGRLSKSKRSTTPQSIMQRIQGALPDFMPMMFPANSDAGSRIAGARLMASLLNTEIEGIPTWQIVEDSPDERWGCPKLIQCMPEMMRDPDNPEDVLKVDHTGSVLGDDPYDSARMGLVYQLGAAMAPVGIVAERRVEQYAKSRGQEVEDLDINTIAQLHRRAVAQETARRGKRRGGLGRIWRPRN